MATTSYSLRRAYKQLGLQQLRSFCEVCRLGGYAPAARALLLTGPAVWEQIKALERHFEVELLERHGNGVRPTPQGRQLLELVRPLLAGLDSTKEILHQRGGTLPHKLTIVTNLRVLSAEVSQAMFEFRCRYATVRLGARYIGSDEVIPLVLDGTADVMLTLEPGPDEPMPRTIVYEPGGEVDYLLLTPPRHPLARSRALRLTSIVAHPLVLGEPRTYSRQQVERVFHRDQLLGEMKIAVETSSDEYTAACVRAGLGLGIAVGCAASPRYAGLAVRPLRRWFGTARVGFMWQQGAHVPPLQRLLAELLRQSLSSGNE